MAPNQYIMASDNNPALLPLLREKPELAKEQDEHGYSLIHAAASYNHLELLRTLVREFNVPVDLRDEDSETALFVIETVDAAKCLVEELGLDATIRGDEGYTAAEKIAAEGDFPLVAEYLQSLEANQALQKGLNEVLVDGELPPPPEGMSVTVGTMPEAVTITNGDGNGTGSSSTNNNNNNGEGSSTTIDTQPQPDPEFRRRIEQLAAREDFHTEQGQAALRQLVEDAVLGQGLNEERNVRPRQS